MKNILLLGAGKSATCLIDYLLSNAPRQKWHITVADHDLMLIKSKIGKSYYATSTVIDIQDDAARLDLIKETDLVISLLPSPLHMMVVKSCLQAKKNLLTAAYIEPEVRNLQEDIEKNGLLFMYEMGLDPGINHMSAMKLIHSIEKKGGQIFSFKSYCGCFISPDSSDNPWQFKLPGNARNIVLAGSSGAIYKEKGKVKELNYEQLFDHSKTIQIPGLGKLAYYPNCNSLGYMKAYHLENLNTFMRATLHFPDFCEGWNALVKLGLTENTKKIQTEALTYNTWATQHLNGEKQNNPEESIAHYLGVSTKSKIVRQLRYIGLLNTAAINQGEKTNAGILQSLLENKLKMEPTDKDMVVMMHEIEFERRNMATKMHSYMIVQGEDNVHTAMAKTIGLPLGIMAKLMLQDKILLKGLHIPVMPEIYNPILKELEDYDVRFEETFE